MGDWWFAVLAVALFVFVAGAGAECGRRLRGLEKRVERIEVGLGLVPKTEGTE